MSSRDERAKSTRTAILKTDRSELIPVTGRSALGLLTANSGTRPLPRHPSSSLKTISKILVCWNWSGCLFTNGESQNIELLRLILAVNPNPEIQGVACSVLVRSPRQTSKPGTDSAEKAEAKPLFQRVIDDYGQFEFEGELLSEEVGSFINR